MATYSEDFYPFYATVNGSSVTVGLAFQSATQTVTSRSNADSPILSYHEIVKVSGAGALGTNEYIGTLTNSAGQYVGILIYEETSKQYFVFSKTGTLSSTTLTLHSGTTTGQYDNWNLQTGTAAAVCFLAGSNIATPEGETAVQDLNPGDLVLTLENGVEVAKPVTWVGHRSVKPGDLSADDAHPIRITAGAFGEDLPLRDLLVTAEHCLFIDSGFIPARLLVNGRSIYADRTISSFTFYHVELAEHAILLAEGLPTESYLDTGNRANFANAPVSTLRPQFTAPSGWENAAAPLTTAPEQVKPVWDQLNTRAVTLEIPEIAPAATPEAANLRVATASGGVISPFKVADNRYFFMLSKDAGTLRLVSATSRPVDVLPYLDDRRQLGVLVGEITLHDGRRQLPVNTHLMGTALPGWFAQENPAGRWTDGNAVLNLPADDLTGMTMLLEIEILASSPVAPAMRKAA